MVDVHPLSGHVGDGNLNTLGDQAGKQVGQPRLGLALGHHGVDFRAQDFGALFRDAGQADPFTGDAVLGDVRAHGGQGHGRVLVHEVGGKGQGAGGEIAHPVGLGGVALMFFAACLPLAVDDNDDVARRFHQLVDKVMAEQDVAIGDDAVALDRVLGAGQAADLTGFFIEIVVHGADARQVDHLLGVSAHHRDVAHARLFQGVGHAGQQRPAAHVDHAFRAVGGQFAQGLAAGGRQDHRPRGLPGRQVAAFGLTQFVVALQLENLRHGRDVGFDPGQAFLAQDAGRGLAHGGDRGAQVVVGPDSERHARLAEVVGRRGVILGRHDHDRHATRPLAHEFHDLVRRRQLGMAQHCVGPGLGIGMGAVKRLVQPAPGDEGLQPRDDGEVRVGLAVFAGFDLARELIHVGQRLTLADEGIGFREQLVLDADTGDAALAELGHRAAHVVEVAPAGIAVDQDRDRGGVGHEFQNFQDLGPGGLVVVAHAERRRHGQAGRPDALEPGFLDDLRRQAVMGLHDEFQVGRGQHLAQFSGLGQGFGMGGAGVAVGRDHDVSDGRWGDGIWYGVGYGPIIGKIYGRY